MIYRWLFRFSGSIFWKTAAFLIIDAGSSRREHFYPAWIHFLKIFERLYQARRRQCWCAASFVPFQLESSALVPERYSDWNTENYLGNGIILFPECYDSYILLEIPKWE